MEHPPLRDVPLFSKRGIEGEFVAWALVWTRDYGAVVNIDRISVDNYGRVYGWDSAAGNAYVREFDGTEVNTANYNYWFLGGDIAASATIKYVLGIPIATPTQFDVWRYGAIIFSRNSALDEVDANSIQWMAISPDGKFVALIVDSIATGNLRHMLLYEGT